MRAHRAATAAPLPRTWQLQHAGANLAPPPELRLPLADPLRFVERHRERLGAHARAVRGLAGSRLWEQALSEAVGSLETPRARMFAPAPVRPAPLH